jgi:Tol biopolymer transport system component
MAIALLAIFPCPAQANQTIECDLRIMFYSNRNFEPGLYSIKPDGSDVQQLITFDAIMPDREFASFSLSPDAKEAAVSLYHIHREPGKETADKQEIFLVNFEKRETALLFDKARNPLWSPDGKKLAFLSGDIHRYAIFIHDFESATQSVIDEPGLPLEQVIGLSVEDWLANGNKLLVRVLLAEPYLDMTNYAAYTLFLLDMDSFTSQRLLQPPDIALSASWGMKQDEIYYDDFVGEDWSIIKLNLQTLESLAVINLNDFIDTEGTGWATQLDIAPDGGIVFESIQDDIYVFDPETKAVTNITNTNTKMTNANDQESYPRWFCQPTS